MHDDDARVDQEEQLVAARADDRVCPVSGDIPTMAHTLDYRRAYCLLLPNMDAVSLHDLLEITVTSVGKCLTEHQTGDLAY